MYENLSFRSPFRKYQRLILDDVVPVQTDRKYHIVAPAGSGKTIIGLELVRQFGEPAVIFAPTTTIQTQWLQKLEMFVEPSASLEALASMDPRRPVPIRILTYQVISTSAQAQENLRQAALVLWADELMLEGQAPDPDAALQRQKTILQNNPASYHKELLHYAGRVKQKLLREPGVSVERFLHPNARRLIDDLVATGVKTVVLDECHHLLDYWAIVLRYLIGRIESPRVVGLTATLPSPEDDEQFENYNSLLGDVDFEIPTPAVVKEGDLAPYQDLAYLVKPTPVEMRYLDQIQAEFETAIASLTKMPRFVEWVRSLVALPPEPSDVPACWIRYWEEHPLLTLAAVRFLNSIGSPPDPSLSTPVEAFEPMQLEDWSNLLERFGMDVLKTSPDASDHELLRSIRKSIQPFGLTLTERGMSQGRSPGDLVLTFSEAKDFAVAHILEKESLAMGERLRALVVTDFESLGTGIGRLKGVLDKDAGSAVRLFRMLASHRNVRHLTPTLVTGSMMMVPAEAAGRLLEQFTAYLKERSIEAACSLRAGDDPAVVEVVGEGAEWSSGTYVRMVTDAFERGLIKCLIGTRGILGEGWDSPSLNTLIDLTSVTTSTAVQQLRGRAIRLDPNWPRKLAHNWDVVCIAPGYRRGKNDFLRFLRRHSRYWSLVVFPELLAGADAATPPALHGVIARGVVHVNPHLIRSLLLEADDFGATLQMGLQNHRAMLQVPLRDRVYDLWKVGEEYKNHFVSSASVNIRNLKIRTVFTLQTSLRFILRDLLASILAVAGLFFSIGAGFWLDSANSGLGPFLFYSVLFLGLILLAATVVNAQRAFFTLKDLVEGQHPDAILADIGRALLEALSSAGLVGPDLKAAHLRVVKQDVLSYGIHLEGASPADSSTFIQAYREIFEPARDQRYLIMRTDDRVPIRFLNLVWAPLRSWARGTDSYPPAYYPVPRVLAARRESVELYAKAWARYVGGGEIVFTRSELGRAVLLSARSQRRPRVNQMAFETWR